MYSVGFPTKGSLVNVEMLGTTYTRPVGWLGDGGGGGGEAIRVKLTGKIL